MVKFTNSYEIPHNLKNTGKSYSEGISHFVKLQHLQSVYKM